MKRLAAASISILLLIGCTPKKESVADDLAAGKAVFERACHKCHSSEMVLKLHKTRIGWEETIKRMVDHGAEIKGDEPRNVAAYLYSIRGE